MSDNQIEQKLSKLLDMCQDYNYDKDDQYLDDFLKEIEIGIPEENIFTFFKSKYKNEFLKIFFLKNKFIYFHAPFAKISFKEYSRFRDIIDYEDTTLESWDISNDKEFSFFCWFRENEKKLEVSSKSSNSL